MNVPFPSQGLSNAQAFSRQEPLTSSDLRNARPFDPVTGRERGSPRSGSEKYLPARVRQAPVRWLSQITFDGRKNSYAAGAGSLEWPFTTPSTKESVFGVLDRQGNVYGLDGTSSIVKVNTTGQKVWTLTPPIKDPLHVIRALYVDDLDNVYVGVSEAGRQSLGRLWRFSQKRNTPPKQEWELSLDAFLEMLVVRGDLVYTAQNMPDRNAAAVVVYRGALSTGPTEAWRSDKPAHPINDFALKFDGSVIGASGPNATRGIDPRYPTFTERTEDWTIRDLTDVDKRLWLDLDAATLDLDDGEEVTLWEDQSGNDRDLSQLILVTAETAPKFNKRGLNGLPTVFFRGGEPAGSSPATKDILRGVGSPSASAAYDDQHLGMVPAYAGAAWCKFIVFRPEEDRAPTPLRRTAWGQPNVTGPSAANPFWTLYTNRNSSDAVAPGIGSFQDDFHSTGVGVGLAGNPYHFDYSEVGSGNTTGAGVLTILHDGGRNIGADDASRAHSLLRWNGKPIDRWQSKALLGSIEPALLGISHFSPNIYRAFRGDVARIIVLRDHAASPQGILSHPHYPVALHNASTAPVVHLSTALIDVLDLSAVTEMEKIEGWLAHKYGISHLLPSGAYLAPTYSTAAPFSPVAPNFLGNYPHPFSRLNGPPRQSNTNVRSEPYQMHSKQGCVWKLDGAKGELHWVITGSSGEDGGGLGYSVAVDSVGHIFSVGPKLNSGSPLIDGTTSANGTGDINVRKIEDRNGKGVAGYSTLISLGNVAWISTIGASRADDFLTTRIRIGVDDKDNLYVPINHAALGPFTLKVYAGLPDASGAYNVGNEILSYTDPTNAAAYAVALPPSPPYRFGAAYDWDRNPTTDARQARTEFVYLFVAQPNLNRDPGILKIRLVTVTPIAGALRQHQLVMIQDGALRKFDTAAFSDFAGSGTLAVPQMSAASEFFDGAVNLNKVYITDGKTYVVWDPILDTVTPWTANDGGTIPPRGKLLCNWRGRMVLTGSPDDRQNWHMSALDDPRSWDRFGQPLLSTRAISGNNARAGLCPDIINAMIPYTDQMLIFGCDHSIWAIVGDPADEGQMAGMRQVSAVTGMAFGRSWALDPKGNLYFFGSRGGVYVMVPGHQPVSMTQENIDQRLLDIDLTSTRVELEWDTEEDGLRVVLISDSGTKTHYFWARRKNAWQEDSYSAIAHEPCALLVADGDDPEDRVYLFGGRDGYIRRRSRIAKSDDGEAIEFRALIGPLAPEDSDFEFRFRNFQAVLARDQDGVHINLYGSDTPDKKGSVRASFEFGPGRNATVPVVITAAYVWVEVVQANPNRRFSIESMRFLSVTRAGRKRVQAAT